MNATEQAYSIIYCILFKKDTCDTCNLILCSKSHLFPKETALLKHNNQSNIKACLKKSIKLLEDERQLLQLFTNQLNMAQVRSAWVINLSGKNEVRNLQYGSQNLVSKRYIS